MFSRFGRWAAYACCALALAASTPAHAGCVEPELGKDGTALISPPEIYIVGGAGRLQFYSAPDFGCAIPGVFVIPRDELIVYGVSRGDVWASVMYAKSSATGWVRWARLKRTGWTMGPKQ